MVKAKRTEANIVAAAALAKRETRELESASESIVLKERSESDDA